MFGLIECEGCGRGFQTEDAEAMLAAIKGACPTCGGSFRLATADAGGPDKPAVAPRGSR